VRDTVAVQAWVAGKLPSTKDALRKAVHEAPETVVFTTTGPGEPVTFAGTEVPANTRLWVSRPRWCAQVSTDGDGLRLN